MFTGTRNNPLQTVRVRAAGMSQISREDSRREPTTPPDHAPLLAPREPLRQ